MTNAVNLSALGSNGGTSIATWTTGTRPSSPRTGQMGYNSTTGLMEVLGLPGGFLKISRNCAEKMIEAYPRQTLRSVGENSQFWPVFDPYYTEDDRLSEDLAENVAKALMRSSTDYSKMFFSLLRNNDSYDTAIKGLETLIEKNAKKFKTQADVDKVIDVLASKSGWDPIVTFNVKLNVKPKINISDLISSTINLMALFLFFYCKYHSRSFYVQ